MFAGDIRNRRRKKRIALRPAEREAGEEVVEGADMDTRGGVGAVELASIVIKVEAAETDADVDILKGSVCAKEADGAAAGCDVSRVAEATTFK